MIYFISKAVKGKEFLYSKKFTILCKTKKQAKQLADYLNENDKTTLGDWKLKDGETWHPYEDGDWYKDYILYKLKSTRGKIAITLNV